MHIIGVMVVKGALPCLNGHGANIIKLANNMDTTRLHCNLWHDTSKILMCTHVYKLNYTTDHRGYPYAFNFGQLCVKGALPTLQEWHFLYNHIWGRYP